MRIDIKDILFEEFERTRILIISNMQSNDQMVSGRTAASLRSEATDTTGTLYGADYFDTLETGISPFQSSQIPYGFLKSRMDSWLFTKHKTQIYRNTALPNMGDAYQNQRQFGSTLFRQTGGAPTGKVFRKEISPLTENIKNRIGDIIINTKILP